MTHLLNLILTAVAASAMSMLPISAQTITEADLGIITEQPAGTIRYYQRSGQSITDNGEGHHGIIIRQTTDAAGHTKAEKVVR